MPLVNAEDLDRSSLLQIDPVQPPVVIPSKIASTREDFNAVYIDLSWSPNASILSHAEGSSWTLQSFYSQNLTKDSELSGVQMSLSGVYQNYTRIVSMEIKVSSPLTSAQDDVTKAMQVSGSGTVYGPVVPNEGDHFVADMSQGQLGVFRITSSVKRSLFKESIWTIEYDLDTTAADKRLELEARTTATYYWNKSYLLYGKNPLVTTSEWDACKNISSLYYSTVRSYLDLCLSKEFSILAIPGQGQSVICDHTLSRFFMSIIGYQDDPRLNHIRRYSISNDVHLGQCSVLDAISRRDGADLQSCWQRYDLAPVSYYRALPRLRSIAYSGATHIVRPSDAYENVDCNWTSQIPVDGELFTPTMTALTVPYTPATGRVNGFNLSTLGSGSVPLFYPGTQDDYYIFSSHFYAADAQMSVLEQMVRSYISGQAGDPIQVHAMLQSVHTWPKLERAYYAPIVLALAKSILIGL